MAAQALKRERKKQKKRMAKAGAKEQNGLQHQSGDGPVNVPSKDSLQSKEPDAVTATVKPVKRRRSGKFDLRLTSLF